MTRDQIKAEQARRPGVPIRLRNTHGKTVGVAWVSHEDAVLASINWLLHRNGYAYRKVYFDGKRRNLYLHRYVMRLDWGCGKDADHLDNDRLNNRRNNLEVVTNTENNLRKWMRYWQGNAALSMPLDDGIPI